MKNHKSILLTQVDVGLIYQKYYAKKNSQWN